MNALATIQVPTDVDALRALSPRQLYAIEALTDGFVRGLIDELVCGWAADGWSQQRIADELGCSQQAVSKRMERLGVRPAHPAGRPPGSGNNNQVVIQPALDDESEEEVEADEVLPPVHENGHVDNGRIPLPTNETVAKRLAATADVDEERSFQIWCATVDRYGADASPEQVAEIAAEIGGVAPTRKDVDLAAEAKRCASAVSRAVRKQDPRAAKMALAIWRASVYRELDRIARMA